MCVRDLNILTMLTTERTLVNFHHCSTVHPLTLSLDIFKTSPQALQFGVYSGCFPPICLYNTWVYHEPRDYFSTTLSCSLSDWAWAPSFVHLPGSFLWLLLETGYQYFFWVQERGLLLWARCFSAFWVCLSSGLSPPCRVRSPGDQGLCPPGALPLIIIIISFIPGIPKGSESASRALFPGSSSQGQNMTPNTHPRPKGWLFGGV